MDLVLQQVDQEKGGVDHLCAHLLRLDVQSRHRRFGCGLSAAGVAAYARRWSPMAAFALVDSAGAWRGVVEIIQIGEGRAELALSIEAEWRGQGWGRRLLGAAAQWGRRHEIGQYELVMATHNPAMQALASAIGARSHTPLDGYSVALWALDVVA